MISPLLFLFFLLQWRISPYRNRQINSIELMSLLSSFLTVTVIFLSGYQDQSKDYVDVSTPFSAIIMIFVLCFYLYVGVIVFKRQNKLMIFIPEVPKGGLSLSGMQSSTTGIGQADESTERGNLIKLKKIETVKNILSISIIIDQIEPIYAEKIPPATHL